MTSVRPRTLATRFLLVVLLGAVVPMAIVGLWLTRSSARSGRELLVGQLTASADAAVAAIDREWGMREGELQLLANNESALRIVRGDTSSLAIDTAYLTQLTSSLQASISSVSYAASDGTVRWSLARPTLALRGQSDSLLPRTMVRVGLPVPATGAAEGAVRVELRLAGIVPASALLRRAAGDASLIVADSAQAIWSEVPDPERFLAVGATNEWAVVTRRLPVAGLRLLAVAPVAPYVTPFRTAARDGAIALLAASVVALLVAALLSRRLVASLSTLADAADRVAAGQLDASVQVAGSEEVTRLGTAFNAMTESLRLSVAELSRQRSLAAVGEFAASLSHDVRNSLTAVRVDLQHASRHLPEGEQGTLLVRRALDSVRRLDATVTSALSVARSGQAPAAVRLDIVLRRAIEAARPTYADRMVTLQDDATDSSLEVQGSEGALEQMLLNLLLNAAEAVDAGATVFVRVARVDDRIEVTIHDAGIGIPAPLLAAVGTPLHTTKANGTGLGLPIARRIAEAHGGTLHLASEWGVGTTVTVSLPRIADVARSGPSDSLGEAHDPE